MSAALAAFDEDDLPIGMSADLSLEYGMVDPEFERWLESGRTGPSWGEPVR